MLHFTAGFVMPAVGIDAMFISTAGFVSFACMHPYISLQKISCCFDRCVCIWGVIFCNNA